MSDLNQIWNQVAHVTQHYMSDLNQIWNRI